VIDVEVNYINDVNVEVLCDLGIGMEIQEYFTFKAPGYRFHPKFKAGMWNGDIKLFSPYRRVLPAGLLSKLKNFCKQWDYSITIDSRVDTKNEISPKAIGEYVDSLDLAAHGERIKPRDYQYYSIWHSITNKRATVIVPTSGGKSLQIYSTIRWYLDHEPRKVLLVVPSVGLVSQMHNDFIDYSSINGWSTEDNVHCITAGITKMTDKNIVISTWQSIWKMPKTWFAQFGMAYFDEAHLVKGNSLQTIGAGLVDCPYRIGTTGTTGSKIVNEMVIQGTLGPIKKIITTEELMNRGQVAKMTIKCVSMIYPEIDAKECKSKTYHEEIDFIIAHDKRNRIMMKSLGSMKGNKLILFNKRSHGKVLVKLAQKLYPDKKIFYVDGNTPKAVREEMRHQIDELYDSICIFSYGTSSTGVSIRNLNHVIFGSPSKSEIRVLQSLGRGLRKSDRKDSVILWDFIDDLSIKKYKNFVLKHSIERWNMYQKEAFDTELIKINL